MTRSEVRKRRANKRDAEYLDAAESRSALSSSPSLEKPPKSLSYGAPVWSMFANLDEYAWFVVFLMALVYFIITRSGGGHQLHHADGLISKFSKPYDVVSSTIWMDFAQSHSSSNLEDEAMLRSIFYLENVKTLQLSNSQISKSLTLAPNHDIEVILSSSRDIYSDYCYGVDSTYGECNHQTSSSSSPPKSPAFFSHLLSTTWVHDTELGRGFLLIADGGRSGRIWRWEVGGGPITIGKSLYMERSGCRSGLWVDELDGEGYKKCPENLFGNGRAELTQMKRKSLLTSPGLEPLKRYPLLLGSASLVVELTRDAERSSSGKNIIVAEWGERRIVRVEGESGARTPLVTLVPHFNSGKRELRRIFQPNHLTYTPFGDLIFSDNFEYTEGDTHLTHVGVIYRLIEAVHVPPIPVEQSREAHRWNNATASIDGSEDSRTDNNVDILFQVDGWIDGIVLGGQDYSILYVSVIALNLKNESDAAIAQYDWKKTIYELSLNSKLDNDEDVRDNTFNEKDERVSIQFSKHTNIFYNIDSNECRDSRFDDVSSHSLLGSKLAIDEKGTIYMVACSSSVMILAKNESHVIGTLELNPLNNVQNSSHRAFDHPIKEITSVNFGEDGYLYITSPNELIRVKTRVKGTSLPTNLLPPLHRSQT